MRLQKPQYRLFFFATFFFFLLVSISSHHFLKLYIFSKSPISLEMVSICWQCGDIGFKDALIYCARCKSAPRHSYCLDEVIDGINAEINWICDDCKINSPNSTNMSRFPKASSLIPGHSSEIAAMATNNPCRTGAPGTVGPSSCFKLNEVGMEESWNEKLKRVSRTLQNKDMLDKSQPFFDARSTDNQFAAKRFTNNSCETSNKRMSNCDISSLGTSRLFSLFELNIDTQDVGYWKLKGRRSKRRLILPSKGKLDSFNPLFDGKDANISLAVKRIPITVSPSCIKLNEDGMGKYGNEKSEFKSLVLPEMNKLDKSISLVDLQDTEFAAKRLSDKKSNNRILILPSKQESQGPLVSGIVANSSLAVKRMSDIEQSDSVIIEQAINYANDTNGKINLKCGNLIQPIKEEISNVNSPNEVKSSVISRRFNPVANVPFDAKSLKSNSSHGAISHITARSSACFNIKQCQVEEQGKENPLLESLITVGMNSTDAIHPPFEAKVDRNGKEKLESGKLILDTNVHLKCLHPASDKRVPSVNFLHKSLHATFVVASDRQNIGRTEVNDQMKFPRQHSQSMPVVSHVWRGTFNIKNGEFGPFRAHLSNKACKKVCNLARRLPLVLHMQRLPRFAAWPNSFKVSPPTNDNIALYFSPESHRVEIVLDSLVDDIINNDLMLKCYFDEVELLVFSSFLLPREHQRLYGKYYAWGVFKPRSAWSSSVPAGSHAVANAVAEENQVDNSKSTRKDDKDYSILIKDSAQEIIEYNSCPSLVQTKGGTVIVPDESTQEVTSQEFSDFHSGRMKMARVASDSLDTCDKKKVRTDCCTPSTSEKYFRYSDEELRVCEKNFICVNHDRSISKNLNLELEDVTQEGRKRVDMVSSRVRTNIFRGGIEHQSETKKLGNMLQYTDEKQTNVGSCCSRYRRYNSSEMEEGEFSDFDNSSVTDLSTELQSVLKPVTDIVAEQQSVLEQSAEDEQMPKELPKLLPGIEAGEVCDDDCFDDSQNHQPTYLTFNMENMGMGINIRMMATQGISR